MPVFQDVTINTRQGLEQARDFFRNTLAPVGPSPDLYHVTLPDDTVPVFLVLGDSASLGNTSIGEWSTKGITPYVERQGDDWPLSISGGGDYGYFWNKFMAYDSSSDPSGFIKSVNALVNISLSGDNFLPVHPRMGGQQLNGNFTYTLHDGGADTVEKRVQDLRSNASGAADGFIDPSANTAIAYNGQPGSVCPLWDFARSIKGLFRKADGTIIPPYFIFLAVASTRFGSPGLFPYFDIPLDFYSETDGNTRYQNMGYAYRQFKQVYIRPGVNHIMNVLGKNPVHVGNLFMLGGIDGAAQYPDEYQLSAGLTTLNLIESLRAETSATTAPPTVQYLPWFTQDTGKDIYPPDKSELIRTSIKRTYSDSLRRSVNLDDMPLVTNGEPGNNGIYMNPISYAIWGERFAGAYRSMLTTLTRRVIAPTMANIDF